jgi:hypothetical protein
MSTQSNPLTPTQATAETSSPVVDNSVAENAAAVTEKPQEEVINEKQAHQEHVNFPTKIEQDSSEISEKQAEPSSSSSSSPTPRPNVNTPRKNSFLDTTLDGLASTFSRLDPIAQKLGRRIGQVRQV